MAFQAQHDKQAIPLFLITQRKRLVIYTTDYQLSPKPGQTLISLVQSTEEDMADTALARALQDIAVRAEALSQDGDRA